MRTLAFVRLPAIHSTFQAIQVRAHIRERGLLRALIVVQDTESAERLANDLDALASRDEQGLSTAVFPPWAHSPYGVLSQSIRARHQRLKAEALFQQGGIVVATLEALLQPTIPSDVFQAHCLEIKLGTAMESRESLRLRLSAAGYRETQLVEDPGDFCIRGEIMDLFPVSEERPLRIEWFDTTPERIRTYDPSSQRTIAKTERRSIVCPPAREILPETAQRLREIIKEYADHIGIPRQIRDPVVRALQDGGFPDASETWGAWAYPETSRFLEWWPAEEIVWVDRDLCFDVAAKEQAQEVEQYERKKLEHIFCPPERLFAADTVQNALRDQIPALEFISLASPPAVEDVACELLDRLQPEDAAAKISAWKASGWTILLGARNPTQAGRIRYLLEQHRLTTGFEFLDREIGNSIAIPSQGLAILSESSLLGGPKKKPKSKSASRTWSGLQALADLSQNDVVVHRTHGLGVYRGLSRIVLGGSEAEFLILEYAKGDRLYVPIYRLDEIQKYAGSGSAAALDRLGTSQFLKAKERARESAKKLAFDLIQLHAKRALRPALRLSPPGPLYQEFEDKFAFDETEDQLAAIQSVMKDLESDRPMDRLICGDVGFGKTEIAMRAAFRCVEQGFQVVVLVPTTVLAFQHEESFRRRFEGTSVKIAGLSRLKSRAEQKETLAQIKAGRIDILVGTHRALSKDVEWSHLGLVVVDEEHRFGVEHKEKLKTLSLEAHLLTLTATPIPRTLHMAMAGIRDLSVISTPPVDRLPIKTTLSSWDDEVIQQAIESELAREGQVFFLHNKVETLHRVAEKVRALVPKARISVAHGQMGEGELEAKMLEFYSGQSNVLVCTTIIESGLDLPRANTILMDQAENLGLAQLYQLRGRVGRSDRRAYCYLLIGPKNELTREAKERLEIIQRFVELGSGFSIASHDLELRGGGNLLGPEQSGHVGEIGFDLYMELLEEAVRELRDLPEARASTIEPELKLPYQSYLDESYVPDIHQRLNLYRRLSSAESDAVIGDIETELVERFGPLPIAAQNLLWTIRLKLLAKQVGIESITAGMERASIQLAKNCSLSPQKLVGLVISDTKRYQLTPESKLVIVGAARHPRELFLELESLCNRCYAQ